MTTIHSLTQSYLEWLNTVKMNVRPASPNSKKRPKSTKRKLEETSVDVSDVVIKVPKGHKVERPIAPFVSHKNGGGFTKPFASYAEYYG